MRVALMVITDGRQSCMRRTMESIRERMVGSFAQQVIINDSLDPEYCEWLDAEYGKVCEVIHHTEKRGFCGAIQSGWSRVDADYVVHCEDDFVLHRDVSLRGMISVLQEHPYLAQMILKRQAWSPEEKQVGGYVNMWPDEYLQCRDDRGNEWLEHRLFFSTNVGVYGRGLLQLGWPDPPGCERAFTEMLLEDPDTRFGIWGTREDEPWIWHIGDQRVGSGY